MDLCEQLNREPCICGNVGNGTVREMQQWIEYLTLDGKSPMADLRRANGREDPWRIRFWGVGNENWGCGGHMRELLEADSDPDLMGNKRYVISIRRLDETTIRLDWAPHPRGEVSKTTAAICRFASRALDRSGHIPRLSPGFRRYRSSACRRRTTWRRPIPSPHN